MITFAPARARVSAVARPMPDAAPVTTAVFPSSLMSCSSPVEKRLDPFPGVGGVEQFVGLQELDEHAGVEMGVGGAEAALAGGERGRRQFARCARRRPWRNRPIDRPARPIEPVPSRAPRRRRRLRPSGSGAARRRGRRGATGAAFRRRPAAGRGGPREARAAAFSPAMRRSQASASSNPPPCAAPPISATTTCGSASMRS